MKDELRVRIAKMLNCIPTGYHGEIVDMFRLTKEAERKRCRDIVERVGLENWHPADALKLIDEGN